MNLDHQQVIIRIDSERVLSIVSMDGKPEVAIIGIAGVEDDTVTRIYAVDDLYKFMQENFGELK